jgi:hypothetical protein
VTIGWVLASRVHISAVPSERISWGLLSSQVTGIDRTGSQFDCGSSR